MECPVCLSSREVRSRILPEGLRAFGCAGCGGYWLRAVDYWFWRAGRSPVARLSSPQGVSGLGFDRRHLKLCPQDRTVLDRYRVGTGDSITIDRCARCSGVWLDGKEWEILVEHDLHEHLHDILDPGWQDELRTAELAAAEHARCAGRLPAADLRRVEEVRVWLESHPMKADLYAILQDSSPGGGRAGRRGLQGGEA